MEHIKPMKAKTKMNWAELLKTALEKHPLIIIIALFITAISQLIILGQGYQQVQNIYKSTIGWRSTEEQIINRLSASINIAVFEKNLGIPVFVQTREEITEYSFSRKGYWVQAITDQAGTVLRYAVTVCDPSFKPTFKYNPVGNLVTIGVTTFSEVADSIDSVEADYFLGVNTANAYMTEKAYYGNPSNYQTVWWGLNDACNFYENISDSDHAYLLDIEFSDNKEIDLADQKVNEIRARTKINTFGISSPFEGVIASNKAYSKFQLGVDRVLLRTSPNQWQ